MYFKEEEPIQGRLDIVEEPVPTFKPSDPAMESLVRMLARDLRKVEPVTHKIVTTYERKGIKGLFGKRTGVTRLIPVNEG